MKKILAALALSAAALTGAWALTFDMTTYIYTGTNEGGVFQQYCYTNGVLCVITDAADQVVSPTGLVLREDGYDNTYTIVRYPDGMELDEWIVEVKTDATINNLPETYAADVYSATNFTGETVTFSGSGVSTFTHWDKYLLLMPCFEWFTYSLEYDKNAGTNALTQDGGSAEAGDEVTLIASPWTRTGYTSAGWSTNATDATAVWAEGATVTGVELGATADGTVTLYNIWEKTSYTVDLDANGGTLDTTSATFQIDEAWSLPTPTREHYTFLGWATSASGSVSVQDGDTVTEAQVTEFENGGTLYAQWEINSYTIRVGTSQPRLGTVSPSGDTVLTYGETLAISATPGDGSSFVSWSDGGTEASRTIEIVSNAVYWASFAESSAGESEADTATVYYLPNGGYGAMDPRDWTSGETFTLDANTFSHTNATFAGWSTDASATADGVIYADGATLTDFPDSDCLVLYAIWEENAVSGDESVAVELASESDGWTYDDGEGHWLSGGFLATSSDGPTLTGTVTGSGTLTYAWKCVYLLGASGTPCVFSTNGTAAATLESSTENESWQTNSVTIVAASDEDVTELVWQRQSSVTNWVKDVMWTAAADPVVLPADVAYCHVTEEFTYDGSFKTGVVPIANCSVLSNATAMAVGTYVAEIAVDSGAVWSDGSSTNIFATWAIVEETVVSPFGDDGTVEPVDGDLPVGNLSHFDGEAEYDGTAHGIDTNALAAAFADYATDPLTVLYADSSDGDWSETPITLTDAGATSFWYRVDTTDFGTFTHGAEIRVTPRDIANATVTVEGGDLTWTGEALTPAVTVTDTAPATVTEDDYTLAYSDNTDVGTATVTVTGQGNYTGTVSATFSILAAETGDGDGDGSDSGDGDDDDDTAADVTELYQGVSYTRSLTAPDGAKVTASRLPSGLRVKKVDGAYVLTGTPKKSGTYVSTFKTKVGKVTTATTETFSVTALPDSVIGTFNGGGDDGQVTLKTTKAGKVSGKWLSGGVSYSAKAAAFSSYDADSDAYTAEVTLKKGKTSWTTDVVFMADDVGGYATNELFWARENVWKTTTDWKTLAKQIVSAGSLTVTPGTPGSADTLTLKFSTSGKVTVKGKLTTTTGVTTSVSGSSVLCPIDAPADDGSFTARVNIYFAPKSKKLPNGYVATLTLAWDGSAWTGYELEESVLP